MIPAGLPNPAFVWKNQDVRLYHGTVHLHAPNILKKINVTLGKPQTDFGRGFYTTTVLRQAQSWAWQLAQRQPPPRPSPIVIAFDVSRNALAALDSLWFVRGSYDADDFWSLVQYCRSGGAQHARSIRQGWYDLVIGPVAASWRQKLAIYDADQISFHTTRAAAVLNRSRKSIV
jgi:Protein of unknown function (DUF3990)